VKVALRSDDAQGEMAARYHLQRVARVTLVKDYVPVPKPPLARGAQHGLNLRPLRPREQQGRFHDHNKPRHGHRAAIGCTRGLAGIGSRRVYQLAP
jgi:hypothetical protein